MADRTWQAVYHHPAADLDLTLVMDTSKGGISGSVTSPSQGTSVQIVEDKVEVNRLSFEAPMSMPLRMETEVEGMWKAKQFWTRSRSRALRPFPLMGPAYESC